MGRLGLLLRSLFGLSTQSRRVDCCCCAPAMGQVSDGALNTAQTLTPFRSVSLCKKDLNRVKEMICIDNNFFDALC